MVSGEKILNSLKNVREGKFVMMKNCTRVSQILLLVVFMLGMSILAATSAHASSLSEPTHTQNVPHITLPAHCFSTLVHADSAGQPIAECKVPGKMVGGRMVANVPSGKAGRMSPFVNITDCGSWGGYDARINSNTSGSVCFAWAGYMGISPMITQVTEVCGAKSDGWVLYYKDGGAGTKFYFNSWDCHSAPIFDGGDVGITQINLGP